MSEAERIPVEFIVYAHQRFGETTIVNKWQLGRLVSQILLLCTLRLCALKDVKSLHDAGRRLGQLEQSTQAARDRPKSMQKEIWVSSRKKTVPPRRVIGRSWS
jgi:hypothetical protein